MFLLLKDKNGLFVIGLLYLIHSLLTVSVGYVYVESVGHDYAKRELANGNVNEWTMERKILKQLMNNND